MNIYLASNNKHKLKEYQDIFNNYNIKIDPINKIINENIDIKETGKSFKQNSFLKVECYKKYTKEIILADDSGIIINFLGKDFPGIYTHRFSNLLNGQKNTNEYLSNRAKNEKDLTAFFNCTICLLNLTKEPLYFEGITKGSISTQIKGENGFGYDPIFICDEFKKTYAELKDFEKNKVSHRYKACIKLINFLKENNFI